MVTLASTALAGPICLAKYNYTYPSTKYKIVEGSFSGDWNTNTITSVPGGVSRKYYAYGACQCQSTLSVDKSFYVGIGVRRSGDTANLSTATLSMSVPKNGKSAITQINSDTPFYFELNKKFMYHVDSYAPKGIKGVYQGGVNDRLG